MWAQYCLYLFGRLLDDERDKHLHSVALRSASTRFEKEAQRVLVAHVGSSRPFWRVYRRCVYGAKEAFYRVDALQRQRDVRPQALLREYAKVSSVFQVAPAALCTVLGRMGDFPRISRSMRSLALYGQILDDLTDLVSDLDDGRFNYVARHLLMKTLHEPTTPRDVSRKILNAYCFSDTIPQLFDELWHYLGKAKTSFAPLKVKGLQLLFASYADDLTTYYNHVEQQRAKLLFQRIRAADSLRTSEAPRTTEPR